MSLRALATKPTHIAKAFSNLFIVRNFDNFMRRRKGAVWLKYKDERAVTDTHTKLGL